jgi:hypothetical protein
VAHAVGRIQDQRSLPDNIGIVFNGEQGIEVRVKIQTKVLNGTSPSTI